MFTTTIATPHNAVFTVICDEIPVNPSVNVNFNYLIGPHRNTLKPYNHLACVTETSVWTNSSTSLKRVNSYHNQQHRVIRANHAMPSSCKSTPPRSSNRKVQKLLETMMRTEYHQSRDAHRVPLAKESGQTPTSITTSYLRDLSKGNCSNQNYYTVLKDRVRVHVPELYGKRNLPAKHNPRDLYPSKLERHT